MGLWAFIYICYNIWLHGCTEDKNNLPRWLVKTKNENHDPVKIYGQQCDLVKFPLLTY